MVTWDGISIHRNKPNIQTQQNKSLNSTDTYGANQQLAEKKRIVAKHVNYSITFNSYDKHDYHSMVNACTHLNKKVKKITSVCSSSTHMSLTVGLIQSRAHQLSW